MTMNQTGDRKPKVAYLGPPASYSHQAALAYFNKQEYGLEAQKSIQGMSTESVPSIFRRGIASNS